jgi:hypothetical protein
VVHSCPREITYLLLLVLIGNSGALNLCRFTVSV